MVHKKTTYPKKYTAAMTVLLEFDVYDYIKSKARQEKITFSQVIRNMIKAQS